MLETLATHLYTVGYLAFQTVLYAVAIIQYIIPSKPHKNHASLSVSSARARSFYSLLKTCRVALGNTLEKLIHFLPDSRLTQGPYNHRLFTHEHVRVNTSGHNSFYIKSKVHDIRKNTFVLHFFGGGFLFGSPQMSVASVSAMLKPLKASCLSVNYGSGQDFTLDQMVDHAEQALNWIKEKGVPDNKIVIFAESAGCILATMLVLRGHKVNSMVFSSPMVDLTRDGQSYHNEYNFDTDYLITKNGLQMAYDNLLKRNTLDDMRRHSLVKLSQIQVQSLKVPIYMFWSPLEIFYKDIIKFADLLKRHGVNLMEESDKPSTWHCYSMYHNVIPEAQVTVRNIIRFMHKQTRN